MPAGGVQSCGACAAARGLSSWPGLLSFLCPPPALTTHPPTVHRTPQVMKRRQERELAQLFQYELKRKEMQEAAEAKVGHLRRGAMQRSGVPC